MSLSLRWRAALGAAAGQRMLTAGSWLLGSQVGSQLLRLAGNLVLARLLAPDAFGLMAALNTLYFGLVMFSDLGLWQIVVQSGRVDPRFLGTVWVLQILRAVALAGVVLGVAVALPGLGSAGWVAAGSALADPRLPAMVAAFALCALLQGGESMKLALAQREMRGKALARLELLAQVLALAVTLAAAAWSPTPWALVAGAVASAAARCFGSHWSLAGPSVRPCWDPSAWLAVVRMAKWMVASSVLGFLAAHAEKLMLGALLTTASFGLFSIASLLAGAAGGLFSSLCGQVVLAGLSEARRGGSVAPTYRQLQRWADWGLGLGAGLMATLGPWIIYWGYDSRYQEAATYLQVLALGLVALRHQVIEQLMFAQGAAGRVSLNNAVRALSLGVAVPAGMALQGTLGAVVAVVACQFAAWPLSAQYLRTQGQFEWATQLAWILPLALGAALGLAIQGAAQALA